MAREAGGPRVRYIGFVVESAAPVERQALIDAVRRIGRDRLGARLETVAPWLTRFDGTHGIVRCAHTGVAELREILQAIDTLPSPSGVRPVRVRTLGTSGTIRALTAKHVPQLADGGRGRRGEA